MRDRPSVSSAGNTTLSRRRMMRGAFGSLAGLGALALAACGGEKKSESGTSSSGAASSSAVAGAATATAAFKRGGSLRAGAVTFQNNFDPHYSSTPMSWIGMIFDPLVGWKDAPAITEKSLAESMEQVDPTTLVFRVRKGVKFSDGTDFDAKAVVWNLTRATQSTPAGAVWKAQLESLSKVEASDDSTVRITLKNPDASMLTALSLQGGVMLSPSAYEGKDLASVRLKPVGTGAYLFDKATQDQFWSFKPNPSHWRKREDGGSVALLDEVRFDVIPDPTVITASLETGQIHLIVESPETQYAVLDKNSNATPYEFKGYSERGMWINHGLAPFDNVDFRRAVAWAVDPAGLNKALFDGRYGIATSWLHPQSWGYKKANNFAGFDQAKARMYLERSGITGDRRRLTVSARDELITEVEYWRDALNKVGIPTQFVSSAQAMGKINKNLGETGEIHMVVNGLTWKPDPHLLASTQLTQKGSFNYSGAPVGEIEPLVQKGVSTYNLDERKAIYGQIQDIEADQIYSSIVKLDKPFFFHAHKSVGGLTFTHDGRQTYVDMFFK